MISNILHTLNQNTTIEFPHDTYSKPIQPSIEFNYESEDMELDEETGYKTDEESVMSKHEAIDFAHAVNSRSFEETGSDGEEDLDEWLKTEMEKHMSKQDEKNEEDALIAIIKSIKEECRAFRNNKQINASETDLENSSKTIGGTVNNDSFTNSSDNIMPRRIYEYLELANLGRSTMGDMTRNDYLRKTIPRKQSCPDRCIPGIIFIRCFMMMKVAKIVECGPPVTLTQVSAMDIKKFCRKSEQGALRHWVCFCDHERRTVKGSCMGFAYFLQVRYGNQKIDDTTREQRYYEWVAQNYEFDNNRTPSTTTESNKYPYKISYPTPITFDQWDPGCHMTYTGNTSNNPTPFSHEHSELGKEGNISKSPNLQPFRPRPCDYSFDEWLKVKIGHTNICNSDRERVFNEWILNSYDVEEEYANEIGDPYSRRFNEYKQVFDKEIELLSNEYILRIGKRGFEEDELWRNGDEKTDYEPPFVDIKTFEVKRYSFKREESFICITKQNDDALPLGQVNGARFRAMIRKELKDKGIAHDKT
ncbi:hypothetical protein Tco_0941477 [Tanacetum coccineum]|uniref:Uncharacterized protein n=1 Tax=Tanacetum coccineum TaxID=301880 RepID=A0ABQ5DTD0_9ASTR